MNPSRSLLSSAVLFWVTTTGVLVLFLANEGLAFSTRTPLRNANSPCPRRTSGTNCGISEDTTTSNNQNNSNNNNRRAFLWSSIISTTAATATAVLPLPTLAAGVRYVLDEETGDYVEVEDPTWQTEWKSRLDKASGMSRDEIFQAARGAGNTNLKVGPESDSSKKRRAMSACRDVNIRSKVGLRDDEKQCTARVLNGEIDFLLEALASSEEK